MDSVNVFFVNKTYSMSLLNKNPLKRRKPLRRCTPLSPISKNKERRKRRFIPAKTMKALKERSGGQCECYEEIIGATQASLIRCMNRARDPHHVKPKGRGGNNDLSNLLHICRQHHFFVHHNPNLAERNGWLKR